MRHSQLERLLTRVLPTGRAILIEGPPGIGKSQTVKAAAKAVLGEDAGFLDFRPGQCDITDLRGVPSINKARQTEWCPPNFIPTSGCGVMFIDELDKASVEMQNVLLEPVLDRTIAGRPLPPRWFCVAAANRIEDRAGSNKLTSALLNRMVHVTLHVSNDDWDVWAVGAGVHPMVRAFMKFKPDALFNFDAKSKENAQATPRSWEILSDVLQTGIMEEPDLLGETVCGTVGSGRGTEFCAFLQCYSQIPSIDAILSDPDRVQVPNEASVGWALAVALVERCPSWNQKQVQNATKYVVRMRKDFTTFVFVTLFEHHAQQMIGIPEAKKWWTQNSGMLTAAITRRQNQASKAG